MRITSETTKKQGVFFNSPIKNKKIISSQKRWGATPYQSLQNDFDPPKTFRNNTKRRKAPLEHPDPIPLCPTLNQVRKRKIDMKAKLRKTVCRHGLTRAYCDFVVGKVVLLVHTEIYSPVLQIITREIKLNLPSR